MLKVENLHTYHGYLHVLKGVSFELEEGELYSIVGSNGAGKSTLLGTLSGVYEARQGSIRFNGKEMANKGVREMVASGISLVPERRQIFDSISVQDNLMLGAFHRYKADKASVKRDLQTVLEIFPRLTQMLERPGGLLSGGEQQMLAIGRGIMARPRLLMLDEPSLGLAPLIVKDIMNVLRSLCKEHGTTIILVEQNVRAALAIADRASVIERGEIFINGTAKELLTDPRVQEAYFGKKRSPNEAGRPEIKEWKEDEIAENRPVDHVNG